MARALAYLVACAAVAGVLWIAANTTPFLALQALWVAAWIIGIVVTWRVARRDGLNPVLWVAAALVIGPVAWVLIAMRGGARGE